MIKNLNQKHNLGKNKRKQQVYTETSFSCNSELITKSKHGKECDDNQYPDYRWRNAILK